EAGAILRNPIDVDQRDFGDTLLQHADLRFDQPLPLLRRLVLGVLTQVAQLARALDLLRQFELQLVVQLLDFVFEFLDQALFHRFPMGRSIVPQCYPSRVTITSRQNPLVARFRDAARGDAVGVMLLDGAHLVADAIDAGIGIQLAAVTPASRELDDLREVLAALSRAAVEVAIVSAPVMDAISQLRSSSAIVALAERPDSVTDRLYAGRTPLVVVAVEVQDPGNVGAIARVA